MVSVSLNQIIPPKQAIFFVSLTAMFTNLSLVTFDSYAVLYLERDLLLSAIIITIIISFRNILLYTRWPAS